MAAWLELTTLEAALILPNSELAVAAWLELAILDAALTLPNSEFAVTAWLELATLEAALAGLLLPPPSAPPVLLTPTKNRFFK